MRLTEPVGQSLPNSRRRFLTRAAQAAAGVAAVPFMAKTAQAVVAPSEKIVIAGIGIGNRGSLVLSGFLAQPDVHCVAVCDTQADRRERTKNKVDSHYGTKDCVAYRDFRELLARDDIDAVLITTGSNNHAMLSMYAARAGKDVYCEKPCTKTIGESIALADTFRRTARVFQGGMQRRNVANFDFAVNLARSGSLGKLQAVHASASGLSTRTSGWLAPDPQPSADEVDWDLFLGTAAWRPFNKTLLSAHFEKGGGLVGGGVLEWGSHCIDLCQWANDADSSAPVAYRPAINNRASATYANGVELVIRDDGWLALGTCPIRFEGDKGWIETGDSGRFAASSDALLAGAPMKAAAHPINHIREFVDCVKSRGRPRVNADVACQSHIACHAANIAIFLGRPLRFDPMRNEFLDDAEANRFREEAARDPWRMY